MAAEAKRASLRGQESFARNPGEVAAIARRIFDAREPAVEHNSPKINDLCDASDEFGAQLERLRAMHAILCDQLSTNLVAAESLPARLKEIASHIWLAMEGLGDSLRDLQGLGDGICNQVYAERSK